MCRRPSPSLRPRAGVLLLLLLGAGGLDASEPPALNSPVRSIIGYHIRPGKHDVTFYDWERYLDFTDLHLSN